MPKDTDDYTAGFEYVYSYKDHLGNVRLSYTDADGNGSIDPANEIVKESNYYPFGLAHQGYNGAVSPFGNSAAKRFMFGGKELDESFNGTLNTYDFGARNYDPALGRWMNLDPLAEQMRRHSPYNYAFDNPVFFIDSDGMKPCPNGDCPDPPSFLERAKNGLNQLKSGISNLLTNSTSGKVKADMAVASATNESEKERIQAEHSVEKSNAMGDIAEGTTHVAKGSVGAVAEVTDRVSTDISDGAYAATVLSSGATAPFTMPLAKGADFVSTTSKVVKGTIHASDGNNDAAAEEFGDAAMDLASARIVKKVSKHIESIGGYDTNTQKDIQESVFGQVIDWFRNSFSSD